MKSGITLLIVFSFFCCYTQPVDIAIPDGYAGYNGTTGGGNASPITVTTPTELINAVTGNTPAVIIVDGNITISSRLDVGSNKTLVGTDSLSGITGDVIKVQGNNYILQNLTIGSTDDDAMEVSGATNVFITKCDFFDSSDELLSIVREADFVTVSWCRFYFDNPDSHSFAHLIGNSDSRTTDRGKLHVTMHHNWYDYSIRSRMPRVRFGFVHIYNNYYNSIGNGYCIGTGFECHIRVENCHFDDVEDIWQDYGATTSGGIIGWDQLKLDNASLPTYIANSYPAFSVPYSYTPDSVCNVQGLVTAGAGNVFGSATSSRPLYSDTDKYFKLFPNPVKDMLVFENSNVHPGTGVISLYNSSGQMVKREWISKQRHQLDLSNLVKGIYFLTWKNPEGKEFSKKVMKQ